MTDVAASSSPVPRLPRWVRALLGVSLAVNLLILGAVAGAAYRFGGMGRWGGPPGANAIGYVNTLPPERRREIFTHLSSSPQQIAALRRDLRQAARARSDAIIASPFDRQRLAAAQQQFVDVEVRLRTKIGEALVDAAATMTPEERRRFARWRGMGMERRGGGMDEDPKGPPPKR